MKIKVTYTLPVELVKKLKHLAIEEGKSQSDMVQMALEKIMQNEGGSK